MVPTVFVGGDKWDRTADLTVQVLPGIQLITEYEGSLLKSNRNEGQGCKTLSLARIVIDAKTGMNYTILTHLFALTSLISAMV